MKAERIRVLSAYACSWLMGKFCASLILIAFMDAFSCCAAADYYVSPAGKDTNQGTLSSPFGTLYKACQVAGAGDTVYLLPGTYFGYINPVRSGTEEKPIRFISYERRKAILEGVQIGSNEARFAILLTNVDHIVIEGIAIDTSANQIGMWIRAQNSRYIRIADCSMRGNSSSFSPFRITDCDHFLLKECDISDFLVSVPNQVSNMITISGSNHVVIAGNAFSRTGHSPLQFYPNASSNVVVRGNVFHGGWTRNFEVFTANRVLFESNVITAAYNGAECYDGIAKLLGQNSIFRYNSIYGNRSLPLDIRPYDTLICSRSRLYNNVFHDNYEAGILIGSTNNGLRDLIIQNNVFYGNDKWGSGCQIRVEGEDQDVVFFNNLLASGLQGMKGTIWMGDPFWGWGPVKSASEAVRDYPKRFVDCLEAEPLFVNEMQHNYRLQAGSPLIDKGRALTQAVGAGHGITLAVKDASFFFDGFGIKGENGDLIAVGAGENTARIVTVDTEKNVLLLDKEIGWAEGDAVSLTWAGSAPDIGIHEVGGTGLPHVHIETSAFEQDVSQEFEIKANFNGITPVGARWWLGDGSIQDGFNVKKTYERVGDHAIRVRISDDQNRDHYAAAYVLTKQSSIARSDFINNSFEDTDSEWWWRWKFYRPTPASYELSTDSAENRSVHVFAPVDGGILPATLRPSDWNIDKYPIVSFQYRISPGTPLGIYLLAFITPDTNKKGIVCIGKTEKAVIPNEYAKVDALATLPANDEWGSFRFDVRTIRTQRPNLVVLQGIAIQSAPSSLVTSGQGYWLDDFRISTETDFSTVKPPQDLRIER